MSLAPTRKQESWRYANIAAVEAAWPLPEPEYIIVPEGHVFVRPIIQNAGTDSTHIQQIHLGLGAGARAAIHVLNIGARYGRIELHVTCHAGADFTLTGVQIGGGEQTLEIITSLTHAEPGATSRQIVRSVLAAQATGSYLGKIEVAKNAQKTDASQSSKAMLLARTATANAKPELIIHADDVKCAHGATVGELDKQALFYLAARGIDPAGARQLLIEAFIAEALAEIVDEALREQMLQLSTAKMQELLHA